MFSRRQVLRAEVLDINSLLGNLLKMLRRLIGENISLIFDGTPEDLWVEADPGMLEQVVVNLVVNARDAMPEGGSVTITTRQAILGSGDEFRHPTARPGHFVCLEVSDTGCGIDPLAMKHIFEPFFTTKDASKGTGLGLATVYGIITQHDGWVDVQSNVGQGSRFRVFLPFVPHRPAAAGQVSAAESVPGGHETILLVEDENSLRHCAAMVLRQLGYEVLEAMSGREALDVWQVSRERIALLVTDMVMPGGLSGLDLIDRLLGEKPSLKAILMTGYSNETARFGVSARKNLVFIQKPFGAPTLARAVRDSLDASGKDYVPTYANTPARS
jgi:CheY-like chemotaxis protein